MGEIRKCDICDKRTDFWIEVVAKSQKGDQEKKTWKMVMCSECANFITVDEASNEAKTFILDEKTTS